MANKIQVQKLQSDNTELKIMCQKQNGTDILQNKNNFK